MKLKSTSYFEHINNATVAELILKYIRLEGTDKIFGIPGAALMHLLYQMGLEKDYFTYVIAKHETGAAYMAEGYFRVTGKPGVVMVTSGPGATNALTGTMNAQNNNSAVLTISGEVDTQYFGKGYLQEGIDASLNIDAIYNSATQYSSIITNADSFQTLFTQALRDTLSLPPRASHISLPDDIAATALTDIQFPQNPENYRAVPDGSNIEKTKTVLKNLLGMERPLLFLGNGTRIALRGKRLKKLIAFVEKFGIPVVTTPDGKGVFPEDHALSLRNYGIAGCLWPNQYTTPAKRVQYDCLLVIGSSMGEFATGKWNPNLVPSKMLMQVDLDQSIIARGFPVELGVVAEVGVFLDQLFELSESHKPDAKSKKEREAFIAAIKKTPAMRDPQKMEEDKNPMLPQALMKQVNSLTPTGSHIFIDCANIVGWSLQYLQISPPTEIHYSLAMGPLGFAVAGVIGAKMGAPNKPCLALVGDGAFMMHGSEISTAAHYKVGAVWIVLNDNNLEMVSQGMEHFFPPTPKEDINWASLYELGHPNVRMFAEALGADAYDAHTIADIKKLLPQCFKDADSKKKPQVIVAHINHKEVPPFYPPAPPKN